MAHLYPADIIFLSTNNYLIEFLKLIDINLNLK